MKQHPLTEITTAPMLSQSGMMRLEEIRVSLVIREVLTGVVPAEPWWQKIWRVLNMDVIDLYHAILERYLNWWGRS